MLMYVLQHGYFLNHELSGIPAAIVDGCIVNIHDKNGNNFKTPPQKIHETSVKLCMENVLKLASSILVVQ
jgi:hypothetical protein